MAGLPPEMKEAAEMVNEFSGGSAVPQQQQQQAAVSNHTPSATPLPVNAARFATAFSAYGLAWNPFHEPLLAVGTAQNFGIIGTGKVSVLSWRGGQISSVASIDTKDGVYDVAWNEEVDSQLVYVQGDGSVVLWDYKTPSAGAAAVSVPGVEKESHGSGRVLQVFQPHRAEVYAVSWSPKDKSSFFTASWDYTLRLYTPVRKAPVRTFSGHTDCVYDVAAHPNAANQLASAAGDGTVKVWDSGDSRPVLNIPNAHKGTEVLCVDWCKYQDNLLASGGVDQTIQLWDLRNTKQALDQLSGHQFSVRSLAWSPHNPRALASASYDMTIKVWDTSPKSAGLVASYEQHTEFTIDTAWNLFRENVLASSSWDQHVYVWNVKSN